VTQAAERAQDAAQRAHERAEQHAAVLRTASFIAIGVIGLAVLASLRGVHADPCVHPEHRSADTCGL
jgi:hypothetical protein